MSNIGFMRRTTEHIESLFKYYLKNQKKYPSAIEKEGYKKFVFQMERLYRYGEMEDIEEYKKLMQRIRTSDLSAVMEIRKAMKYQQTK